MKTKCVCVSVCVCVFQVLIPTVFSKHELNPEHNRIVFSTFHGSLYNIVHTLETLVRGIVALDLFDPYRVM